MNLDEAQKIKVAGWLAEGLKLSEIQSRLASELGITATYMDVRFLVDDLKLTPKDTEPPKTAHLTPGGAGPASSPGSPSTAPGTLAKPPGADLPPPGGNVAVKVDQIARPGTVASGSVTFSDGNVAEWYLDQTGRLGLLPKVQGYRPSQQDVSTFQAELQNELGRMGF